MTTPTWSAAHNGFPGDLNAVNEADQIDQGLGTHAATVLYESVSLVTPAGGTALTWLNLGNETDLDQPFVMPSTKTAIGRVTLPIRFVEDGANLLVTLWPDSGGSPDTSGTPLASTYVPSTWLSQQSAVDGLGISPPRLAGPQNNTTLYTSSGTTPWVIQAGSSTVNVYGSSIATSGNYTLMVGGIITDSNLGATAVGIARFSGADTLSLPLSGSTLPKATLGGALAVTSDTAVLCGGAISTATLSTPLTNVWSASWDPNTGTLGAWSAQTALPTGLVYAGAAAYNGFVYVVGGSSSDTPDSTSARVYYAAVSNGSLTSWLSGPPLPVGKSDLFVAIIDGWLIAAGGVDNLSTAFNNIVYYAQLGSDGSVGSWNIGPNLPTDLAMPNNTSMITTMGNYLLITSGSPASTVTTNDIWVLPVTSDGLGSWSRTYGTDVANVSFATAFSLGNGGGTLFSVDTGGSNSTYTWFDFTPVPLISIPLPASGLTATATYHVVMQQDQPLNSSSYLSVGYQAGTPLPNGYQVAARGTTSWSTPDATHAVPMTVYDQTAAGLQLHTWEDPVNGLAARVTTSINAPASGALLGLCESTLGPGNPLNVNPTFTSGVSSWTATNCAFAQSATQTHGGYAFSGRITPNGSSALVYVQSELITVSFNPSADNGRHWLTADCWIWSTSGSSNVSNSVNWFDSAGTFITTSSNNVTVAAATWTHLVNVFEVPETAAQATVVPTIGGTPASSNLFYLSNVTLVVSPFNSTPESSVSVINYADTARTIPVSVTQLA